MPHITLHLDDATHAAAKQAALASGLPTSRWVTDLIHTTPSSQTSGSA